MRNLNCERKKGHLSVWFGNFATQEQCFYYFEDIFCVFDESQHNPEYNLLEEDFDKARKDLFQEKNKMRPFEEQLEDLFEEVFNRFEYDFGVTFDQDFQIINYCGKPSSDFAAVLGEWANDSLLNALKEEIGESLPKAYNCFFAIPSCIYNGYTKGVTTEQYSLDFLGVIREEGYSNEIAEKYNG